MRTFTNDNGLTYSLTLGERYRLLAEERYMPGDSPVRDRQRWSHGDDLSAGTIVTVTAERDSSREDGVNVQVRSDDGITTWVDARLLEPEGVVAVPTGEVVATNEAGLAIVLGQEYRIADGAVGVGWSGVTRVRVEEAAPGHYYRAVRCPNDEVGTTNPRVCCTRLDGSGGWGQDATVGRNGQNWVYVSDLLPLVEATTGLPAWYTPCTGEPQVKAVHRMDVTLSFRVGDVVVATDLPWYWNGAMTGQHIGSMPHTHRHVGAMFEFVRYEGSATSPNIRVIPLDPATGERVNGDTWIDGRRVAVLGSAPVVVAGPSLRDRVRAAFLAHTNTTPLMSNGSIIYRSGFAERAPQRFEHVVDSMVHVIENNENLGALDDRTVGNLVWRRVWDTRGSNGNPDWTVARYNSVSLCRQVGAWLKGNVESFRILNGQVAETVTGYDYSALDAAYRAWIFPTRTRYEGGDQKEGNSEWSGGIGGARDTAVVNALHEIARRYRANEITVSSAAEAGRILWAIIQPDGRGPFMRDYSGDSVVHEAWGEWLASQRDLIASLPEVTATIPVAAPRGDHTPRVHLGKEYLLWSFVRRDFDALWRYIERGAGAAGHGRNWTGARREYEETNPVVLRLEGDPALFMLHTIDGEDCVPLDKVVEEMDTFRRLCHQEANNSSLCTEYDRVIGHADTLTTYFKMGARPARYAVYATETYTVERYVVVTADSEEAARATAEREGRDWLRTMPTFPGAPRPDSEGVYRNLTRTDVQYRAVR